MAEPVFTLKNISYSYPGNILALSGICLEIFKGQRAAVIGANGTGKSTLLALMDALIFPELGTLSCFGEELNEKRMNDIEIQRNFRGKVGYVFQNPDVQLFCPTVSEDILFGPLQLGVSKEIAMDRFNRIVDHMHIRYLLERMPHQLSMGEKKKAALASTLVLEPEVLLLDEPTAGLDPATTREIINTLDHMHDTGVTVIMATHDLHNVGEMADIIHVFGENHALIMSGNAEEILSDTSFLQKNNLAHVHKHEHLGLSHSHQHW